MIKYSGIDDQMPNGISDQVLRNTQLGEKAKQIFASRYQLHLPSEEELKKEIKREIDIIQNTEPNKIIKN